MRRRSLSLSNLKLRAAFAENVRSRALLDGRIVPEGIELESIALSPGEIFARQLKGAEFDISDTSNSAPLSCRAKISPGESAIDSSSMPSGTMRPSSSARERTFSANAARSFRLLKLSDRRRIREVRNHLASKQL